MSDFDLVEYQTRLSLAQKAMSENKLDALVFCTEAEIRYFSGFRTLFWQSPTRPWFLVVPASGLPIAVIPSIGAELMSRSIVEDIRTWSAPDYADDGISLLTDTLREVAGKGRIGTPHGIESHLRMPLGDWKRLNAEIKIGSDMQVMRAARMVPQHGSKAQVL